jgi:molecular chaperone DnaK
VDRTIAPLKQAMSDAGLQIEDIDEVVMVGGMTRMPAVRDRVHAFFGKAAHQGGNPDEVVAIGAAIQAAVLGGDVQDVLLLDVTPLTLSIETLGGVATPQIERNTTIPTRRTQTFSTASDRQTEVEIHILQGERPMAAKNKSLGRFVLDGIPPAPRGTPQIEVTFDIDANGILKVAAQDSASGRKQHITIASSSGLSETEVDQMRRDAEAHAAEDRHRRDLIEARTRSENTVYAAENTLRDLGNGLPDELRSEVQDKIARLRSAAGGEEPRAIVSATDSLAEALQKIGTLIARDSDTAAIGPADPHRPPPDSGVVADNVKE